MREKDPPPEEFRCKRTDGRQWRCKRRAMDGKTLCDIHYLQGKHRQHKRKVPDSLKLERKVTKKRENKNGESSRRVLKVAKMPLEVEEESRRRGVSEALDEALKRMKLKRGDLQLELIRVFLKKQVEKKKEKDLKENTVGDETRQLPYGVMAISQSPSSLQNFRQNDGGGVDSCGNSFIQRHFSIKKILNRSQLVQCRKRLFCLDCIKERSVLVLCLWYLEKQEVKVQCPPCRGTCSCKLCMKQQHRANNHKEYYRGGRKLDRIRLLHYLIYMLLPVLKKINCDHGLELNTESKELSQHSLCGSFKLRSCKRRKTYSSGDELLIKQKIPRQNSGGLPCLPIISSQNRETCEDGSIPCPSTDIGGCGHSLLHLRSLFPFNWTSDLEVRAEEILCSNHFPETTDVSSCCSLCNNIGTHDGEVKPQGGPPRRIGFNGIYLYSPTIKDLHQETLEHFQNHWGRGHPVIVRNVLQRSTSLSWDPVIMFCSYIENKSSESWNEDGKKATNVLDWCELPVAVSHFDGIYFLFTSSSYKSELYAIAEYINPVSGILNVGVKLPKEFPKPDLGPCIYFSYGGPEELMQADYLSKLCYESHDKVNILAYATDAPISAEQINKIEKLMKKYKAQERHRGQSFSNSSDQKGKSSLQSEDTGESSLQEIGEKTHLPNGIETVPFYSDEPLKGHKQGVENGILSDESDSDAETSFLFSGSIEKSEDSDEYFLGEDTESSCSSDDKQGTHSCGAQWDIFPREDVPKLLEYLRRHSNELSAACSHSKHVHPILDQKFFLDAYHKLRLKEEFGGENGSPWYQCRNSRYMQPHAFGAETNVLLDICRFCCALLISKRLFPVPRVRDDNNLLLPMVTWLARLPVGQGGKHAYSAKKLQNCTFLHIRHGYKYSDYEVAACPACAAYCCSRDTILVKKRGV
ncbi:UNVERIFIED_CONTAM: Lysine-specific demethylase [Sesamum angustifolium]|uniref:Lysine-specific demethylase n=1 Tax=Sesamum angustifolium TaxID=2727405 RepID=A0AAW2KXC4_9LAMI